MPKIFISYRRIDSSDITARIYDRLKEHFDVFKDSYSIAAGADFRETIQEEISKCDVVLVIIGPRWLDELKNRQIAEEDLVRVEVSTGLQNEIRVIPVVVVPANMPKSSDLPDDLRELASKNAFFVRSDDPHFHRDMDALIAEQLAEKHRKPLGRIGLLASSLVLLLLAVLWAILVNTDEDPDVAYAFLVDSSDQMRAMLPGSDLSRYAVARQTIYDIVNAPGTVNASTWIGLRTAGGGSTCSETNLRSEHFGDKFNNTDSQAFVAPLEASQPYGSTAYNEGFRQILGDLKGQYAGGSKIRLVFAFLGATQESSGCSTTFNPALVAQNLRRSGIDVLMCAFTFFDDPKAFEDFRTEFHEALGPCVYNAQDADQATIWVNVARQQIQRAQSEADGIIEETLVVDRPSILSTDDQWSTPTPPTPTQTLLPSSTPTTIPATNSDIIEMRAGPGLHYEVAGSFAADALLTYLAVNESKDWLQLELEDGSTGWISIAGVGNAELSGINDLPVFIPTATPAVSLVDEANLSNPETGTVGQTMTVRLTVTLNFLPDSALSADIAGLDLQNFESSETDMTSDDELTMSWEWALIPNLNAVGENSLVVELFSNQVSDDSVQRTLIDQFPFIVDVAPANCPGTLPSRLEPGTLGRVVLSGGISNRLRSAPSTSSNQIGRIPPGAAFDILDGPECSDGYAWYLVDYQGAQGWTVEAGTDEYWLEPKTADTPILASGGVGLTNGAPMDDGSFQAEYFCTSKGYGIFRDNENWYCTQNGVNVLTLTQTDFDQICRETYDNSEVAAIQLDNEAIPAFAWRCIVSENN